MGDESIKGNSLYVASEVTTVKFCGTERGISGVLQLFTVIIHGNDQFLVMSD